MGQQAVDQRSSETELASFVSGLSYESIPDEGVRLAERCFVDTVGVTIAGAVGEAGSTAAAAVDQTSSDDGVRLVGRDATASVTDAAFVNGTAGHGLDFDDVSSGMQGHPSVTMVPALLAVGESEDATGEELLTAFVAGFETQCYLSGPLNPDHYERGWHATATLGTFGATAAVTNLLGLSEREIRHALCVAASFPAGLKRNFGTTTKPIHAGAAARSGVTAARAAANGATGDERAIDGQKGFFELYSGPDGPDLEERYDLGERWAIVDDGVGVKKYPCCYFTHSGIASAEELAATHDIEPTTIESVGVTLSQGAADALHHANPDTGLEGKFSIQYTLANMIARGRVGLAAFDDENVDDEVVQMVRERITATVDSDLPYGSHRTTVSIETADGDEYENVLEEPPGTHENPLSNEELREKYLMCATRAFDRERAVETYDRLDDLRNESDTADLAHRL
ncbi:2-methylcitrate dehydratase PrpD [Natronorubrum sediminis]|uniref:2-methylcitrate dehydratase PrpD n=1 Tax=Natronorubrum sediminis TaxID=640943 RepID=A0A1H6G5F7_9EURY|nr:MmgE/PrpD family protein [Natronorubrum sediminis]SEH17822.1 2-methylcitrate dehydratase PrpD [Natronorubrum sediminis]